MTQAVALAQLGNSGVNFRNRIINGNFDIWQRGTSFTAAAYSADRWLTSADTNSGWTVSQQTFTLGQTEVPNDPTYFLRFAISSGSLAGAAIQQRIEDVRTFSGKTVTATFYAKVSAGSTFTPGYLRMIQNFGSGGSADAYVSANETVTALTSSWVKYTYTFNIPSIAGKTIGAGNYINIIFRIPDSTTTTVDFAQFQVEEGTTATAFERRPIGTELALCQRYYEVMNQSSIMGICDGTNVILCPYTYVVPKRAVASLSLLNTVITIVEPTVSARVSSGAALSTGTGAGISSCSYQITGFSSLTGGKAILGAAGTVAVLAISAEL